MAVEYSVMLYKSPNSKSPFNEIFDYDYQEIRRIAYANTLNGGYSVIYAQTWGHGDPVLLKGDVYRISNRGRPVTLFEFPNNQVRVLNKDGSFGRYYRPGQ